MLRGWPPVWDDARCCTSRCSPCSAPPAAWGPAGRRSRVWSGGLPTPAITDLYTSMGDELEFVDVTPLLEPLQEINEVYEEAVIPAETYELDEDVPTIA